LATHRQLFGAGEVQEFVRAMRIRMRAQHARHEKWVSGSALQHADERMLPPVPRYIASLPKVARDASRIDVASQGATAVRPSRAVTSRPQPDPHAIRRVGFSAS
jgi:hypothetical protein